MITNQIKQKPQKNARDSIFLHKTQDAKPFKVSNFTQLDLMNGQKFLSPFALAARSSAVPM